MNYKTISSFQTIPIYPKTLVLCDIDETILRFNGIDAKWWNNKIEKYYLETNSYMEADRKAYLEWKEIVHRELPEHTDANGFKHFIEQVYTLGGELVFVTARQHYMEELTRSHLKKVIGDMGSQFKLWICGDKSKGIVIDNMIEDIKRYNKLVFIDDNEKHLNAVYNVFGNQIDYYRFEMVNHNLEL